MKKIFLFPLVVFCALSLVCLEDGIAGSLQDVKARGRLIAGVRTDLPPFGYVDNKGLSKGFDIDIAQSLAKGLLGKDDAVEFVPVTSGNGIGFLNEKKIDVLLGGMIITESPQGAIDLSIPYFESGHLILARDESTITRYQDLAGKTVATILGSTGDSAIKELVPQAKRIVFKRHSDALKALKDGQVDAFVDVTRTVIHFQKLNPKFKIAGLQSFAPVSYGLGVRKGDKEWLDFVNATLTKMKQTGQYQRLSEKWFAEAMALLLGFEKPMISNQSKEEKR